MQILFRSIIVLVLFATTRADAADPKPIAPAKRDTPVKLRPSPEDIANDVVRKDSDVDKNDEQMIASSLRDLGTTLIDGKRYLVFGSSHGTLLIPASGGDIKREDISAAHCSTGGVTRGHDGRELVLGAQHPLSEKYTAYAGMMAKVIRSKCGEINNVGPASPKIVPEVGVKWKNGSKTGGEDRIYVNPRGVGAGTSF